MDQPPAPALVVRLAQERSDARARQEWHVADDLRARIEAAGWRVIDHGVDFQLEPGRSPDIVEAGSTSYGTVASIPSRLDEGATTIVSIVVLPGPTAVAPSATLRALSDHRPAGCQVVIVIERDTVVDGPADEVVRTVTRFGPGDALQAALRRCRSDLVIVLDAGRQPTGDFAGPLAAALSDERVAIAGIEGLSSADLRRYRPLTSGPATALRSGCYAFRRPDAAARGPLDARLHLPGSVATWWSLKLRDEGPDAEPRLAMALELPITAEPDAGFLPTDHARMARRDAYRIAELVRGRTWLASEEPPRGRLVRDGAGGDHDGDGGDQPDDPGQA